MFLMRMRVIVLAFSCAAWSLTLIAPVSRSVPAQGQEQDPADSRPSTSDTELKKETTKKKITVDPHLESYTPPRGLKGLGKEFLLDQKQIWTSPAKIRFSDTQWLVPLSGITAGLFVTDASFSKHLS